MTLKPDTRCAVRNCSAPATAVLVTVSAVGPVRFPTCDKCRARLTAVHRDGQVEGGRVKSKPITCRRCGRTWPRDPALEVPCPQCQAPVGVACKRPSGHGGNFVDVHATRDQAAMDAGKLTKCEGGRDDQT